MSYRSRTTRLLGALLVVVAVAAGCSSSSKTTSTTGTTAASGLTGSITVSAASSLTGTFTALGKSFEQAHEGTTIHFNFGSSATLVTQIEQGAAADVFASASTKTMDALVSAGKVQGQPTVFAKNKLEIVVKPGNPLGHQLAGRSHQGQDRRAVRVRRTLWRRGRQGAEAGQRDAGSTSQVTRGADVKATLAEVTTGDADAAVVYVTDAKTVTSAQGTAVPIAASDQRDRHLRDRAGQGIEERRASTRRGSPT